MLGPTDPASLAWLAEHWGTERLRQVCLLPKAGPGVAPTGGACQCRLRVLHRRRDAACSGRQTGGAVAGVALCAAATTARARAMNAVTPPPSIGAGEGESPHLALDGFAGGLASLLSLARTHAIDLARLSIADFIRQVAAALEPTAPAIPLARKADWLVMAAWLVLLRSRLLLPAAPEDPAGAADADRRADRARDLLAAPGARRLARAAAATWHRRLRSRATGSCSGRKSAPGTRSTSSNFSGPAWPSSRAIRTTSTPRRSTVRPATASVQFWMPARACCGCCRRGRPKHTARMVPPAFSAAAENEALGPHHLATTVRRGEHIARRSGTGARRLADRAAEGARSPRSRRGRNRGEAGSDLRLWPELRKPLRSLWSAAVDPAPFLDRGRSRCRSGAWRSRKASSMTALCRSAALLGLVPRRSPDESILM